jgi:hypothetical protein
MKTSKLKLLFLDIDGVLNQEGSDAPEDTLRLKGGLVNKHCVSALNELIDATGAKIVIFSTWRRQGVPCNTLLEGSGVIGEVIGETPRLGQYCFRGNEIWAYIDQNLDLLGVSSAHDFNQYLILDDSDDILYWQRNNFYRTESNTGLTSNGAYRAARQLNGFINI